MASTKTDASIAVTETLPAGERRVHIIGAGPVGLLLAALLQPMEGLSVHLYEKRREYTRTRMVQLSSYLVADSVESYRTDHIDGDTILAVFDPPEIDEGLAFRRAIPSDLMTLLQQWTIGFCPLNTIERSLSDLIDARKSNAVQRTAAIVTAEEAMTMLMPGDILIDCTGPSRSFEIIWFPTPARRTARTRSPSGSNTRWSLPSCTDRNMTAMSIANTTKTSKTRATNLFPWFNAHTTIVVSPM